MHSSVDSSTMPMPSINRFSTTMFTLDESLKLPKVLNGSKSNSDGDRRLVVPLRREWDVLLWLYVLHHVLGTQQASFPFPHVSRFPSTSLHRLNSTNCICQAHLFLRARRWLHVVGSPPSFDTFVHRLSTLLLAYSTYFHRFEIPRHSC